MMRTAISLTLSALLAGCASAAYHRADVQDDSVGRVTLGNVQRQVDIGMSGAEVLSALGSPNIVSTDEYRNEVWVYDKIATDVSYSRSSGGISSLLFGGGSDVAGAAGGYSRYGAGAQSRSQRTMTVVLRFDADGRVRDFAYHVTRF